MQQMQMQRRCWPAWQWALAQRARALQQCQSSLQRQPSRQQLQQPTAAAGQPSRRPLVRQQQQHTVVKTVLTLRRRARRLRLRSSLQARSGCTVQRSQAHCSACSTGHLCSKYHNVPDYAAARSHAEHLARTLPNAGTSNSSRGVLSAKQHVLLMGTSGKDSLPEVLAVATPINAVALPSAKVATVASFTIKSVKTGLSSLTGLPHVPGEAINKKKKANLTSCSL